MYTFSSLDEIRIEIFFDMFKVSVPLVVLQFCIKRFRYGSASFFFVLDFRAFASVFQKVSRFIQFYISNILHKLLLKRLYRFSRNSGKISYKNNFHEILEHFLIKT